MSEDEEMDAEDPIFVDIATYMANPPGFMEKPLTQVRVKVIKNKGDQTSPSIKKHWYATLRINVSYAKCFKFFSFSP